MPTETFFRLPEEKRTRLISAAWEEFTRVPFEKASINKIVLRARIPRGSFYQYFTDKQDLFCYLLGDRMDYLQEQYAQVLQKNQGDFFETQVQCFDLTLREKELNIQLARGMEIFQHNPVFLMQQIVENEMSYHVWEKIKGHVDVSLFRQKEEAFIKQVFTLSMATMAMAIDSVIAQPERMEIFRAELVTRLEILRQGSIQTCRKGTENE